MQCSAELGDIGSNTIRMSIYRVETATQLLINKKETAGPFFLCEKR
jgi:exopolyphosphatase/pppGpp-phosphohydrolase